MTLTALALMAQMAYADSPRPCLEYDPAQVTLTGVIKREIFLGLPESESLEKHERYVVNWVLYLDTPLCVNKKKEDTDELYPAENNVQRVQLVAVNVPDMYTRYRPLVGKRVAIRGDLYRAHTAWHIADVLIGVREISLASERSDSPPAIADSPEPCLEYEPAQVALTGVIRGEVFPGRTEYSSLENGDEPLGYWILYLDKPACVNKKKDDLDELYPAEQNVKRVHLVAMYVEDMYTRYKPLVGKRVVVKGDLYRAHTAWHMTDVLIQVREISRASKRTGSTLDR